MMCFAHLGLNRVAISRVEIASKRYYPGMMYRCPRGREAHQSWGRIPGASGRVFGPARRGGA